MTAEWGDHREWVRFAQCDFGKVKAHNLKHVLVMVDSYAGRDGWCFATLETLSHDTQLGVSTVQRALNELEAQGFIVCKRHRQGRSTIVARRLDPAGIADYMRRAHPDHCRDRWPKSSQVTYSSSEHVNSERAGLSPGQNGRSPVQNPGSPGQTNGFTCSPGERQSPLSHQKSKKSKGNGTSKNCSQGMTVKELIDANSIGKVVDIFLAHPMNELPNDDASRKMLFALAHHCHRKADELTNPVGFFFHMAKKSVMEIREQLDDEHDWPAGKKMMRDLYAP